MLTWPKLVLVSGPSSDNCGMPSRLLSVHERVAEFTDVFSGLRRRANPTVDVCTYRLSVALIAVLPLPNRSYARPSRGDRSLKFGTSVNSSKCRGPIHVPPGASCAPTLLFK